jgi:hypothetical protein
MPSSPAPRTAVLYPLSWGRCRARPARLSPSPATPVVVRPGSHADLRGPGCARGDAESSVTARTPRRRRRPGRASTRCMCRATCRVPPASALRRCVRCPGPPMKARFPRPRGGPAARSPKILTYLIAADADIHSKGDDVWIYGQLTLNWAAAGTAESGQRHEDRLITARRPADLGALPKVVASNRLGA